MQSTGNSIASLENNRVKVAVRCRPALRTEIDDNTGRFFGVVDIAGEKSGYGRVVLTNVSHDVSKSKEFLFDYAFGPEYDQGDIYHAVAEPVVNDFLAGRNGTIFAYGQTGTGKTYTMGVLEFVNNKNAGIIPRTLSRIFDYAQEEMATHNTIVKVRLSFLQLYRETIQDLLAQLSTTGASSSQQSIGTTDGSNLAIREDPLKGFYVEGLQEFEVASYSEAEVLVNIGLENRAIASTLMNTTSSRSHTILTLQVEAHRGRAGSSSRMQSKTDKQDLSYGRPICSKLMLVDLAGSERVRRSVSQGARLAEAKSINSSLSALGNVISALAGLSDSAMLGHTHSHIPYRDSKLTKLLQDSLGGSAATALIATVGPAATNHGETLSTLTFASRCMSVRCQHVVVLEGTVDYVSECLVLREEVSVLEVELSRQQEITAAQTKIYDSAIKQLYCKLVSSRKNAIAAGVAADTDGLPEQFDFNKLDSLIESLSAAAATVPVVALQGDSVVWCKGVLSNFDTTSHQNPNWSIQGVVPSLPDADHLVRAQTLGVAELGPKPGIRHSAVSEREIKDAHEILAASRFDLECAAVRHMELASMQLEDMKRRKNSLSLLRLKPNSSSTQILGSSIPRSDSDFETSTDPRSRSILSPEKSAPKDRLQSMRSDSVSELGSADMSADISDFGLLRPSKRDNRDSERSARGTKLRASSKTQLDSSLTEERHRAPSSSSSNHDASRPHRQQSAASHTEAGGGIFGLNGAADSESQGGSASFDSRDAGSLVDQIGSLSAAQLTLLSPAMREQVMVIRRMLEKDVSNQDRKDSKNFSIEDGRADRDRDRDSRDRDRDRDSGDSGSRSDYLISDKKSNGIAINEGLQSGQPSRLRIHYSHSYDSEGGRLSERDD